MRRKLKKTRATTKKNIMHTQNIFVSILRELKVPFTNSFALLAYEEHPFSKKQIMYKQIMYIRQVTFLIMLCSSVMAFAQKAYLLGCPVRCTNFSSLS